MARTTNIIVSHNKKSAVRSSVVGIVAPRYHQGCSSFSTLSSLGMDTGVSHLIPHGHAMAAVALYIQGRKQGFE